MDGSGQSRNTPAVSLKYISLKLEEQISQYLCSQTSSSLVKACILGKGETILELKPTLQEINHGEPALHGMAPLHIACFFEHLEVVHAILESGADLKLRVEKTIAKETPLHIAAGNGFGEIVKALLEKGADPNSIASNHLKTPLHVAASDGHVQVVKYLLQGGAKKEAPRPAELSRFGFWCTPLHLACQKGHLEIVKVLHQHGANIDTISGDHRGISVLHEAVINHQVDIIKYLINQRVKMNVFDSAGFSPLHIAAKQGYTDIMDLLIKGGSEVDCYLNDPMHTPLMTSITSGQYNSMKTVLEAGAEVDGVLNDAAPLYQAIRYEPTYLPIVELLISFGANEYVRDEIGYYPLHCAAYCGQYEVAEFFLRRGHDPRQLSECPDDTGQRETPLHCAVFGNKPSVLQLLVKAGVSVNCLAHPGKQTPMYNAVLNQKIDMVEQLINLNADVNVKDASSVTPLHHAISSQNNDIIRLLIQKGASLEDKTIDGLTPLHIAVIDGTEESARLLIDSGACLSVTSTHGETPLHFAAELNCARKVQLFLQIGADVNSIDCNGISPLHLASGKGHDAIVELLCKQKNANVDLKDYSGVTPLHLAAFNGHKTAVRILLEAGADRKKTCNGESVSSICCRRGFVDVMREFQAPCVATTEVTEEEKKSDSANLQTLPRYLKRVLKTDGVGKVPQSNEAQLIFQVVTVFVQDLMTAVGKFDSRFIGEVKLSGSMAESCKVGEPDEFDFMLCLPTLAENFVPVHSPDDPAGYCKVELKTDRSGEKVRDLLKDGKYLFPQRIKACLFSHIEDVLLLKRVHVPQEIRCYLEEFMPESDKHRIVSEIKPGFILHLEWRKGLYTGLKITADVIPTLPFEDPEKADMNYTTQSWEVLSGVKDSSDHFESAASLCLIPKPISTSTSRFNENLVWRISMSKLETKILQRIPDYKRDAYLLGKVLLQQSGKVPDVDGLGSCVYCIHTYLLKTAFLVELARVLQSESWQGRNFVVRLLDIFGQMKQNIESGDMPSFFVEGYNLLLGENSIAERTARVWILDAILLFLSGTDDMQFGQRDPRDLETILQSLRPECISSKEVTKLQEQVK